MPERREFQRRRTYLGARLAFNNQYCAIDCLVPGFLWKAYAQTLSPACGSGDASYVGDLQQALASLKELARAFQ